MKCGENSNGLPIAEKLKYSMTSIENDVVVVLIIDMKIVK